MKKISVIVPIYRGNHYIPNLIRMLEKNWRYVNIEESVEIELVLVNDFPTEELKVDERWRKNISLIGISNKYNRGIHFSRVQGVLHSSGDHILFLDQDDLISNIYIKEQLNALSSYDAIICNGKNSNELIYRNKTELYRTIDLNEYKRGYNWIVSPGQVLIKREAIPFEWMENILNENGADDYFLWTLMFCKKCKIGIHDKILYWHLISDINTSNDLEGMTKSIFEMVDKMRYLGYLTYEEETEIKKRRINALPSKNESISLKEITMKDYEKERDYKRMLERWMVLRDRKIFIAKYFNKRFLRKIAIYGVGIFGRHLYYELQESNIQITCFIDRNQEMKLEGIETVAPGEKIEIVDAIVVTPFMEYTQIREMLKEFYECEIISIKSILQNADCELQEE